MNDPKCSRGSPIEDTIHYLLECQLYYNHRMYLFFNIYDMSKKINSAVLELDFLSVKLFYAQSIYLNQRQK